MTGFLFGLALVVVVGQLPQLFGVAAGSGGFFSELVDLLEELPDLHGATLLVGAGGAVALVALQRLAPQLPGTLIVLAGSIALSAAARSVEPRRRRGRRAPGCGARPGGPRRLLGRSRRSPAGGARRAGGERRGGRGLTVDRERAGVRGRRQPRHRGARRLEPPRRLLERLRPVGRSEPDPRRREGGRQDAARLARRRRPHPPDRPLPRAALRGPAAGDARGDRRRCHLRVLPRGRAQTVRALAPRRARALARRPRRAFSSSASCRGS